MTKQTQTKKASTRQPVESTQFEEHECSECGRATITDETGALVCVACGLEWEVETATACQKTPETLEYHDKLQARMRAKYSKPQAQHSPLPDTTGLPWTVETRADTKYPDITLAQVIAPQGYTDSEGKTHRCAVTDWLDSPADARLIVASVNHAQALAEALRGLMSNDFANGTISKRDAYRASALEALRQWSLANREVTQ